MIVKVGMVAVVALAAEQIVRLVEGMVVTGTPAEIVVEDQI